MEKLIQEEEQAIRMLAQECHEELVEGVPPVVSEHKIICNECRNRDGGKCRMNPKGFPKQVIVGEADCPDFEPKEK